MACYYVYKEGISGDSRDALLEEIKKGNSTKIVFGRTVEEIRDLLLDQSNRANQSFMSNYGANLFIYYHAKTQEDIKAGFTRANEAYKKVKSGEGVTVNDMAGRYSFGDGSIEYETGVQESRNDAAITELLHEQQVLIQFKKEFGECLHKAFELSDLHLLGPEITRVIDKYRNLLTKNMLTSGTIKIKNISQFIESLYLDIHSGSQKQLESLINQVFNIRSSLTNKYGNTYVSELEVASLGSIGDVLKGKIDLAFITPDKKVVLIDFKTSYDGFISDRTKEAHFLLLEMYRQILSEHGIDYNDISYINVPIVYGKNGSISSEVKEINPRDEIGQRALNNMHKIKERFFNQPAIVDSEEVQKKKETVTKRINLFGAGKLLKSFEKDSIKQRLSTFARNSEWTYSKHFDELVQLTFKNKVSKDSNADDEEIIVKNRKGNILGTLTLKDLTEKEILNQAINDARTISDIIEIINAKSDGITRLRNYLSDHLNEKDAKAFWANIYPYLSDNYSYVSIPVFESIGLICMKDNVTGNYDFVKLVLNAGELEYSRDLYNHILSSIISNPKLLEKYREAKQVLRPTINNINLMLSIMMILEFADVLPEFKLGDIKCISTINGSTVSESVLDVDKIGLTLKVLLQCCKDDQSIPNRELFINLYDEFVKVNKQDTKEAISRKVVAAINVLGWEKDIEDFKTFEWNNTASIQEKIESLQRLQDILLNDYKEQLSGRKDDIKDAIDYVSKLIQQLLNALIGANAKEMHPMSSYGISDNETFIQGYNILARGTVEEFTKSGLLITGLAQALESSVSYANPDLLNRRFHHFYDAATGLILSQLHSEVSELNDATEKFIKWGRSVGELGVLDPIWGNHNEFYSKLLVRNGKDIDKMMIIRNPYTDTGLLQLQKEYLEVLLWQINRHRMPYGKISLKGLHMSYAEFSKTAEFATYKDLLISNPSLLNLPLKRKDGSNATVQGFKLVMSGKKKIQDYVSGELHRMRNWLNTENLSQQQIIERDKAIENLDYFNYFKDNERNRADRTESTNPEDWDLNLNRIAVDYALSDIREMYFKDLLKIADRALGEIKILELTTGKDFSKQSKALMNQIQISIYGKTLADNEWKDVLTGVGIVKQLTSIAKISVRPMLFVKEMILGRIRNTSAILAGMVQNDEGHEIKMSHLTEAAGIVFGPEFLGKTFDKVIGNLSMGSKSMADVLNDIYAINDRDLSVIGEKFAFDRTGLYNWGSRMLYLNTIAPDWFNRMIIFIAKMKADGTWNAHKCENGKLIYDISKDDRVKEFWINKDHPKNTPDYKKAEAFYKLRMQEFEKKGWKNPDGSNLRYGQLDETGKPVYDAFPRAYTTKEEDSIKEQIGLIYGYYSHQERANMQKGMWWTMYTQFLTFMPAEVRKYLAIGTESSIVKTIQEIDPITKKPLYWEVDESGMHIKTENEKDSKGNFNEPVLKDVYSPYEGLLVSTVKTVGLICRGDFKKIKENPQLLKNTELFMFNLLFAALVAAIIAYLADLGVKSTETEIAADLIKKTGNELSFYHSVMEPVGDFGIVGTDFLQSGFTNSFKAIESDNYSLYDLSENTFAIVKDAHLNLN